LKLGDVVIGILPGAAETKVRPAVVISSDTYLVERPDVLVGILTTKLPRKHLGAVAGAAWMPFAWLGVVLLADGFSLRRFAMLAASLAMIFLAGFPAIKWPACPLALPIEVPP
jgi:hypothetical protein